MGGVAMTQLMNQTVHVRFDGRSEELTMGMLHLDNHATDSQIKRAIANHIDLPSGYLDDHAIVRTSNTIIVRPQAIYG
jgi:hypothetical protein